MPAKARLPGGVCMRMLPADLTAIDLATPAREKALRSLGFAKSMYIMLHPEDARVRDEALATMAADALGRHQADPEALVRNALALDGHITVDDLRRSASNDAPARQLIEDIAKQSLSMVARDLFMPAGGFCSVASAKGISYVTQNAEVKFRDFIFAGVALCTLYTIASHNSDYIRGGASLNKVWFLLERECPVEGPKNDRQMKAIWSMSSPLPGSCSDRSARTSMSPSA